MKILYVCPFENSDARTFVESLASSLEGWHVKVTDTSMGSFLLEPAKYDAVHYFLSAPAPVFARTIRKGAQTKIVQTVINSSSRPDYKRSIFADAVVTFSEEQRKIVLQSRPDANVTVIPPCAHELRANQPAGQIREAFGVDDRLLVVALNDFDDRDHFHSFLYTAREYQRRGGFRFLIPLWSKHKRSLLWRSRLAQSIQLEKLTATTLLEENGDLNSIIQASDIALLIDKRVDRPFSFPISAIQALLAGKPVLTFDVPPVNEVVGEFRTSWLVRAYEDFSRISRDLLKEFPNLEQISTDLARFARSRISVNRVAEHHKELYNSLRNL